MSIEITVPMLPESVADALLLDWHKPVGARVRRDEILVELETDKIVLEVVAPADGVIIEILQQKGATVKAGEVLAKIDAQGDGGVAAPESESTAQNAADTPADSNSNSNDEKPAPHAEHRMSPAVRRLVQEHGLNPADIPGSGVDGRVTKQDILAFIGNQVTPPESTEPAESAEFAKTAALAAPTIEPPPPTESKRAQTREPMSRLRRTIAERLVQVQQTAALLSTFNQVNMQPVMDLRARYQEKFEKAHGVRLGLMSFFVKASVAALQKFPMLNAAIDATDIVQHHYYDIGIAVSSERGLVVPVVRNCERLSVADIEIQIRDFGRRAGAGKLSMKEISGGTFTITNGGVFGSLLSTPIVNPPQSAILGMHKIEQRVVAENEQAVIRPMMYLALSYDHRIIDGQQAVQFLVAIKELLEDPSRILLQI